MATRRSTFASLGLAPLILRVMLAMTFLWAGVGKWMGTIQVQGEDAALLANLDVILRRPPANLPVPAIDPVNGPASAPSRPLPSSGSGANRSGQAPAPGSMLILAQTPAPPSNAAAPVTAGPPLATAAEFPDPVPCRAMWGIALSVHHAAHPGVDVATGKTRPALWPRIIGDGLWPKAFAIAVLAAELGGGVLLLIGLFTRLAAFACASVMLGAIYLTQIGPAVQSGDALWGFLPNNPPWDPKAWMPLGWQLSLLAASVALMCLGSGVMALDRAIAASRAVPERFQKSPAAGGGARG